MQTATPKLRGKQGCDAAVVPRYEATLYLAVASVEEAAVALPHTRQGHIVIEDDIATPW